MKKCNLQLKSESSRSQIIYKICWQPATLLKKRLRHRCFPVNFAKVLRPHFAEHLGTAAFENQWGILCLIPINPCEILSLLQHVLFFI